MSVRTSSLWILATPLAGALIWLPGARLLLPAIAPLFLLPSFVASVRGERLWAAWRHAMVWAALLSATVIVLTLAAPEAAARGIWRAEPYRVEMFGWLETGSGKEADWRAFLPEHALHLVAFVALTWISGGYLGLALGAALTAYMSYFVGSYVQVSSLPGGIAAVVAWVPWSIARVAAFVALGVAFSTPVWRRHWVPGGAGWQRLVGWGALGIALDIAIKLALAPAYGRWLAQFLIGSGSR